MQKKFFRGSLEEASEDEDKADEEAEPYQTPSSEPPNEEIQNHHGSVIQQIVSSENGIDPTTPHSVRQSSRDATNTSTAVEHTRDEQVDHQCATPLAKQARRSGRRSRKKRYTKLKEEMKRLARMQQIQEELDRLKAATSEVEESDFESDFFGHEEEDPNYRLP